MAFHHSLQISLLGAKTIDFESWRNCTYLGEVATLGRPHMFANLHIYEIGKRFICPWTICRFFSLAVLIPIYNGWPDKDQIFLEK